MKTCKDCGCEFNADTSSQIRLKRVSATGEVVTYVTARPYCRECINARNAYYKRQKRKGSKLSRTVGRDDLNYDWYANIQPYPTMLCNPRRIAWDAPQPVLKAGSPRIETVKHREAA